jgi:hypothetical protein
LASRHSRPAGLDVSPVCRVHLVHLGKVVHAREEDVDLDDIVEAGACGLEDGLQVLDAAVGVSLDVAGDELARLGILRKD